MKLGAFNGSVRELLAKKKKPSASRLVDFTPFVVRDGMKLSMAPTEFSRKTQQQAKKRKDAPNAGAQVHDRGQNANNRPRLDHAAKARDARILATQTSSKAFKHGELDVDKFVKSREYEIRAMERGLVNSKKALTKRAFQMVPKELRRRTASHNVKRVPKRLRDRGKREVCHVLAMHCTCLFIIPSLMLQ